MEDIVKEYPFLPLILETELQTEEERQKLEFLLQETDKCTHASSGGTPAKAVFLLKFGVLLFAGI